MAHVEVEEEVEGDGCCLLFVCSVYKMKKLSQNIMQMQLDALMI